MTTKDLDLAPAAPRRPSLLRGLESMSARRFALVATAVFVLMSLFIYWPMWPGDPQRLVGCACGDPAQQSWFLNYTPWALLHGHNPFFTTAINYPRGVNLADNTLMPLLGLLFYPVTWLFGAISTFNLLMWLAYPLSALSAWWVVRRWSGSNISSLVAGLLYGFSPYVMHQGLGHLNLSFVPLPPLVFYAVYKILVVQDGRARRWGALLGVLLVAQYLISSEVMLSTALFGAIAAAVWMALHWREVTRERVAYVARALLPAVAITAAGLAYPIYFGLFGPEGIRVPYQGGISNQYRADLAAALVPTSLERFGTSFLKGVGDRFTNGQLDENGAYLGLPLIVTFLGLWLANWRVRAIRMTGIIAVIFWILSLGPWLVVDAHHTSWTLPFYYLAQLPGIVDALPVRFSLFVMFFVAVTVALALARLVGTPRGGDDAEPTSRSGVARAVTLVLLVASLITIAPLLPLPTKPVGATTPAFFTGSDVTAIAQGTVVLTYPYVDPIDGQQAILWQFESGFRWRMLGSYSAIPGFFPNSVIVGPWPQPPLDVVNFLRYWEGTALGTQQYSPVQLVTASLVSDLRIYLRRYHVGAVVVDLASPHAATAVTLFRDALGRPTVEGGVAAWLHLTGRPARP